MEFHLGSDDFSQALRGRSYVAGQLVPSILLAKNALERTAAYLGRNGRGITTATDEVLQWWSAAAGMYDEKLLHTHRGLK